MILDGIASSSFLELIASGTSITGYVGLLLGGHTILTGIAPFLQDAISPGTQGCSNWGMRDERIASFHANKT